MLLFRTRQNDRSNPARRRHVHTGEVEFLLVEEGTGVQFIGETDETACRAGDLFVFPSGLAHQSWCPPGRSFTALLLVVFDHDLADVDPETGGRSLVGALAARALEHPRLPVLPATVRRLRLCLARALDEQRSTAPGARCALRAAVQEGLVHLARDRRLWGTSSTVDASSAAERAEAHIAAARAYLEAHATHPLHIDDLVALGVLSRSRFLERFRRTVGATVGDELRRLRLTAARAMLRDPAQPLVEVALACGFGSQSHFNHAFRAAEGISPGVWRERHAGR